MADTQQDLETISIPRTDLTRFRRFIEVIDGFLHHDETCPCCDGPPELVTVLTDPDGKDIELNISRTLRLGHAELGTHIDESIVNKRDSALMKVKELFVLHVAVFKAYEIALGWMNEVQCEAEGCPGTPEYHLESELMEHASTSKLAEHSNLYGVVPTFAEACQPIYDLIEAHVLPVGEA